MFEFILLVGAIYIFIDNKKTINKIKNFNIVISKAKSNIITDVQLKNIQNKIKSPCGTQCSVCHNMSGGVSLKDSKYSSDKWNMIKDYTVIEATHGATSGNYNVDYANEKRKGNDNVIYSKDNPYGRFKKFSKNK